MIDALLALKHPLSSPKKALATPPGSPYKLSKEVASPSKLRVMKSLPDEAFLQRLETLDGKAKNEITKCFRMIYDHVVNKGAHGQGKPEFNLHVAATALYEIYHDLLIHNKDHGLKAAGIYNLIINTLKLIYTKIKAATKNPQTLVSHIEDKVDLHETLKIKNLETLKICSATLKAHHNGLVLALSKLSDEKKIKLKECQNIDNFQEIRLSAEEKALLKVAHPLSPSKPTPKKPSLKDLRSCLILQGKAHLVEGQAKKRLEMNQVAQPQKPRLTAIPRTLLVKYARQKATAGVQNPATGLEQPRSPEKLTRGL